MRRDEEAFFMFGMCGALLVFLVIKIFYLLTLQNAIGRCSLRNRTMEPGLVWLELVPLLNLYWVFHNVINVSDSLRNEFSDRGRYDRGDFGKSLGIVAMAVSLLANFIGGIIAQVAGPLGLIVALVFGLGAFVLICVYWAQVAGYSSQISFGSDRYDDDYDDDRDYRRHHSRREYDDDYDDDYDDRPRRRRSRERRRDEYDDY